ncbi:MAG: phosphatidylserine decarboxylase family protein [Candidatus Latescibacterota bacterium]|nr:phosphatidylserine decarboxylase family protein [Candidatus Latescibacterota bacterium]
MIARESLPFLLTTGSPCIILAAYGLTTGSYWSTGISSLLFVLTAFIAFFFRDPDRIAPKGPGLCVASGDGKVVAIEEIEDEWVGKSLQISVFLSIFNVHVNRTPCSGQISAVEYHPGKFRLAFLDKASDDNEHTVVRIDSSGFRMTVKQIAGFVARRIVCRLESGHTVVVGERFGLIRFGSRIDHILPRDSDIKVDLGDHVKAGETVIGVVHEKNSDT